MNAAQLRIFLLTIQDIPSIVDAVDWDAFDRLAGKHGLELDKTWLASVKQHKDKSMFMVTFPKTDGPLKFYGPSTGPILIHRGIRYLADLTGDEMDFLMREWQDRRCK